MIAFTIGHQAFGVKGPLIKCLSCNVAIAEFVSFEAENFINAKKIICAACIKQAYELTNPEFLDGNN